MKTKGTVIFVIIVLLILVGAIVFVPKLFPKSDNSTSPQMIETSSVALKIYTLEEMITESDNVISGTVIKADVDESGVLYTLTVSWKDVLKGRNYATMGYAYINGAQMLELNKSYLFIGDTNEEKYHYKEPFENAPWVFAVDDNGFLTHISNGNVDLVSDLKEITLEKVKTICENAVSSK